MSPHELVAERSLALHAAVADRIRRDPTLIEVARRRVREWQALGTVLRPYADEWASLLALPWPELEAALTDRSQHMHDLRQVSPFAGVLDARTRWQIHREIGARGHATR